MEEFLEIIIVNLIDYLPSKYQDMACYKQAVDKVNGIRVGFRLGTKDSSKEKGYSISTVYYIEDAYNSFLEDTIEDALTYLAKDYLKVMEIAPPANVMSFLRNGKASFLKETVICQLVNAAANKKLLMNVPHRRFYEFAIIYRMILSDSGNASSVVTYSMANKFGFSEEQLYNYALENTRKMATICTLIETLMEEEELDKEFLQTLFPTNPKQQLYYIGNRIHLYGASTILIEERLYELANRVNSDLYLMPSSVHEMLAICVDAMSPEYLADMIMKTNATQVEPQIRLSNSVYMYSWEKRQVFIVREATESSLV